MHNSRKKILYIITKSVWGGAQRYVFDLATNLPPDSFEAIVTAGGSGLLIQRLKEKNIRCTPLSSGMRDIHIWNDGMLFFRLLQICFTEKPDVVHLNSSKIGGICSVAAFIFNLFARKKTKIIFTAHGWAWNEERPHWQKKIIIWITRFSALLQDAIIILSRYDFDSALRMHIPEKKLCVIPNGTPTEHFLAPLDAGHQLSQITATTHIERPCIGVIAELTKNKGLQYLIQALHILKKENIQFSCFIIGDGEEKKTLERMISANALNKNVMLAGFIEHASQYLKAFDLIVLPSIKEGLPYILLEAVSAGIPIISTEVGGIPDIIEHKKNGLLVPPRNPRALAKAIETLIHSKTLRIAFAAEAEIKAKEFSFDTMLQKTINLYTMGT